MSAVRLSIIALAFAAIAAIGAPQVAPQLVEALVAAPEPQTMARPKPRAAPTIVGHETAAKPRRNAGGSRVTLDADRRGHFLADVTINGRQTEALVDTGASTVALTAESARGIGIVPLRSAYTATVSTANGLVKAAPVTLVEVGVGGIRVRNVKALVMPSGALPGNLLGMSFLARLSKFEIAGPQLVLVQ